MSDFDPYRLEGMFDYLILNAISHRPLSEPELEDRVRTLRAYLEFSAARRGAHKLPGALADRLKQLGRDGWLEAQEREAEESGTETVYAITAAGQQRVEQERKRVQTVVSEWIDNTDLDHSFRRFLDSTRFSGSDQ